MWQYEKCMFFVKNDFITQFHTSALSIDKVQRQTNPSLFLKLKLKYENFVKSILKSSTFHFLNYKNKITTNCIY